MTVVKSRALAEFKAAVSYFRRLILPNFNNELIHDLVEKV